MRDYRATLRKLLCRIGLHQWGFWIDYERAAGPEGWKAFWTKKCNVCHKDGGNW